MKYSPKEIAVKTFDRKMMGYDPDQVENFLVTVAAQLENALNENHLLKEALRSKELEILGYKDRDQLLQQTMTQTTQVTEKMKNDAERDCKLIIQEAHEKASLITQDAKDSLKKIYSEIAELKKNKMQFQANLKAMAQAHLALIDQGEHFLPQFQIKDIDIS